MTSSSRLRFQWRMQLMHARTGFVRQMDVGRDAGDLMAAVDGSPGDAGADARQFAGSGAGAVHEAIANRSLALSISMPRTCYADAAWDALRAGRPEIRHAVEGSQGFDFDMTADCMPRGPARTASQAPFLGSAPGSRGVRSA
jgi:hypothetical protein